MRVFSLVFVFLLCVQQTNSFGFSDISGWFDKIKEKIESFITGSNNGTLTDEQKELLEKLNSNSTDVNDFKERLEHIRSVIKDHVQLEPVDQEKLERMINKFISRVRQHIRKEGDSVAEVNEKANVAGNFYQGDMMLTKDQVEHLYDNNKEKRQAMGSGYGGRVWSKVLYQFDSKIPAHTKTVAIKAMNFWRDYTCIDFAESTTGNRLRIFEGQGCYSYVGQIGGAQELSLGRGCDSVGTAAHEVGHALGFFHEQSRHDRDTSITFIAANVQKGWVDQFDKENTRTNNNLNFPYDYGSIMHYGGTSASGNGKPTMVAKKTEFQDTMGSDIISFRDVALMNKLYGCDSRCTGKGAACQNGGIPHPRACNKCICPGGFGGDLCNQRPTGCGATLTATSNAQTISGSVGLGATSEQDDFVFCNWRIEAPAGRKISATITAYKGYACVGGCPYGGIELKWASNPILTGSRYCCADDVKSTVTSETNVLNVIGFNRYAKDTFTISYRLV